MAHLPSDEVERFCRKALHVLLVAQLWDLWPWQLAQLQQASGSRHLTPAAAAAARNVGSSSACSAGSVTVGSSSNSSNSSSGGCGGGCSGSSGGSSRSSSSRDDVPIGESPGASGYAEEGLAALDSDIYRSLSMDWPLLPDSSDALPLCGPGLPPVTLQQMQLAVSALGCTDVLRATSAALLLALLLQRADPGLRADFLGGTGGTALLAACQYWGYYQKVALDHAQQDLWTGFPLAFTGVDRSSSGPCYHHLLAAVQGQTLLGRPRLWRDLYPGCSITLLLAWCYLQLVPAWEQQLPAGDLMEDGWGWKVVSTPYHSTYGGRGRSAEGEVLAGGWLAWQQHPPSCCLAV
jgi:hypothetical protein